MTLPDLLKTHPGAPGQLDPDAHETTVKDALHGIRAMIHLSGDNPDREGITDTPQRILKAWLEMTGGMREDPKEILAREFPADGYDQIVSVRGIEFTSMCEHHGLTFRGVCHVAYLPGAAGRVVGLSKIPRAIHALSRRLQVQERLTAEIAAAIETALKPRGVAVVIDSEHLCMSCRGVRSTGRMRTSFMGGVFRDEDAARAEVLNLLLTP